MKKLFVSILALAAFAACQSNFNDVTTNTPGLGDDVVPEGMVRIYAEVGIGEEGTKATYDDNLNAKWEESDQIALLQESANYGETFGHVNSLNIKSGAGTSYAAFNGDITVPTESPRIYHIAYPASAVKFTTNVSVVKSGDSSYETKESSPGVAYFRSKANFDYKYTSSVSVNVPTTQNGKWEPYLYASTEEAVNSNAIGAKTLTTLTGAIAIRAFEADGTTPKQLKSITVTATKPIAGAFSGESASVATLNVTGDYTSKTYSTEIDGDFIIEGRDKAKAAADELLESKAQSTVPANTSVTNALSLSFKGAEYTVEAEDVAWVAADENGVYTYHLNVAPFEGADLTVMATAVDGSTLVRTISGQSLAAGHRKGYNFKWENATLSVGAIETWYDDCNTTIGLAGNTLYVNNLEVEGVSAEHVLALGVAIDGVPHTESAQSGVLTIDKLTVSNVASGNHSVCAYAKVLENGQEKEIKGALTTKNVTAIPDFAEGSYVRSSYSYNGGVKLDNSVGGGDLRVKTVLNDSYLAANFVQSYTFYYNGNSVNPTLGQEHNITFGYDKWGQYDCYVKLVFGNGYVIEGQKHTAHITGIPFTMTVSSNADGWSISGPSDWNKSGGFRMGYGVEHASTAATSATKGFYMPANTLVKMYVRGKVETTANSSNTFSAKVSGGTVAEAKAESSSWIKGATTEFELKDKVGTMTNADPTISLRNASATSSRATYIYEMKLEYNY